MVFLFVCSWIRKLGGAQSRASAATYSCFQGSRFWLYFSSFPTCVSGLIFYLGIQRSIKHIPCSQGAQRVLGTEDKRGHKFFDTVPLFGSGLALTTVIWQVPWGASLGSRPYRMPLSRSFSLQHGPLWRKSDLSGRWETMNLYREEQEPGWASSSPPRVDLCVKVFAPAGLDQL